MADPAEHVSVLVGPVVGYLARRGARLIVDCTVGLGGHSEAILDSDKEAVIIGLDVDPSNLNRAKDRLARFGERVRLEHASFSDLPAVLARFGLGQADGVLADLGVSSNQISDAARGLSFDVDGPLDMRLDPRLESTAADLVNTLAEGELSDLLYFQSQERHSRRIAKRICQARKQSRIRSTLQLARLVAAAVGENPDCPRGRIHPATRTFMALRMAVNREESALRSFLAALPAVLAPQGRAVVISFHSGEDRLVKEDFRARAAAGTFAILTKKPIVADDLELERNPRSRSAKLRAVERRVGA